MSVRFTCPKPGCNRNFAAQNKLNEHDLVDHKLRRAECRQSGCKRCFTTAENARKHERTEHNLGECS